MGFVTIRKKKSFSPFWGGRGGPIKLTPLFGGVRNHPRKLLPKFQNANSKTLGVMSQKPKSQSINKNCDIFADIKKKKTRIEFLGTLRLRLTPIIYYPNNL